jgi:hypothetical protein
VYQVLISPIQWADCQAEEIAYEVEKRMIEGQEKAGDVQEQYPGLEELRRREPRYLYWSS